MPSDYQGKAWLRLLAGSLARFSAVGFGASLGAWIITQNFTPLVGWGLAVSGGLWVIVELLIPLYVERN